VAGVIRMIGAEEARGLIAERGRLDVTCEFCGEGYAFDHAETEHALADEASRTPSPA
jgi:molecular chaperone Hsp33